MNNSIGNSTFDTIITPDQLRQIVYGIKKGSVPVKFAYLTELGSQGWKSIESDRVEKGEYSMDSRLLESSIEIYLEELGNPECIQIVDIGGGYGYTARSVLEIFKQRGIGVHYHTIDISPILLNQCQCHVSGVSISQTGHLLDIDDGGIAKKIREIKEKDSSLPILITFLGNTIGNFASPHEIIRQISNGLDLNDRLVLGAHLFREGYEKTVMKEYETQEDVHTVLSSTFRTLRVDKNHLRTYAKWNEHDRAVCGYVELTHPSIISTANNVINLPIGYTVEVMKSAKFSIESLLGLAGDNRVAQLKTDTRGLYSQVMLAPNYVL